MHLQCLQYPPKKVLGERSSTWRKENWGGRESSAFKRSPRRSSEEERKGDKGRKLHSLRPVRLVLHHEKVVMERKNSIKREEEIRGSKARATTARRTEEDLTGETLDLFIKLGWDRSL